MSLNETNLLYLTRVLRRSKVSVDPGWPSIAPATPGTERAKVVSDWGRHHNLGVVLGHQNVYAVDCDSVEFTESFDSLIAEGRQTLKITGARGGVRLFRDTTDQGPGSSITYPGHGEIRSWGCYSVIRGIHPSGCEYRSNHAEIVDLDYHDLLCRLAPLQLARPTEDKTLQLRKLEGPRFAAPDFTPVRCPLPSWLGGLVYRVARPQRHANEHRLWLLARVILRLQNKLGRTITQVEEDAVFSIWWGMAPGNVDPAASWVEYKQKLVTARSKAKIAL